MSPRDASTICKTCHDGRTHGLCPGFSGYAVEDAAAQPGLSVFDEAHRDRNRLTMDADGKATENPGVGFSLWDEKLDISDDATMNLPGANGPRLDCLGEILTRYGNRPYTGTTFVAKLMYMI